MPHRERLLKHALDGLRSPATSSIVKEKLHDWYPDRCGLKTAHIFKALGNWEPDDDTIEALFKGLNAEDYQTKRAAGLSLTRISNGSRSIRSRLETIANNSDDPHMVAAVTIALVKGWLHYPPLKNILKRCRTSVVPELRVVGIRGRIALGVHNNNDLMALFKLARFHSRFAYNVQEDVIGAFLEGWPENELIKRRCLTSVKQKYYYNRQRHEAKIDTDIALGVLLAGYQMDREVASFCVDQIHNERFPFHGRYSYKAFDLIAKNFSNHPEIVGALDEWAKKSEYISPMKMSAAAAVGRTETFKRILLESLNEESMPYWLARALLENWGAEDVEVSSVLSEFIRDPRKASTIGNLLPLIIPEKQECRSYLRKLLNNPECVRPDLVLLGLVELGSDGQEQKVIDAVIELLGKERYSIFRDNVKATLIVHFADSPKVRDLACEALRRRNDVYTAVAQAFGSDQAIRESIMRLVNPLPTRLRQVIATYLSRSDVDGLTAVALLKSYDHETAADVKVESAISYYTRFGRTDEDLKCAMDDLQKTIVCVGHDQRERRVAAFCGLVALDRLDVMDSIAGYSDSNKKLSLQIIEGLDHDIPAVRFVLKHWEKLQEHFADEFWQRLFGRESRTYYWEQLVTVADEYPTPREKALEFYTQQQTKVAGSNGLLFISRVRPASQLLLEYCLNTLGLVVSAGSVPPRVNTPRVSHITLHTAAQIMGHHFSEDEDLPRLLYSRRNESRFDHLLLALSEGWPRSDEFDRCLQDMASGKEVYWESSEIRYFCAKARADVMFSKICKLIRAWSSSPAYVIYEAYVRPIVVRLQHDKELQDILIRYISSIATPSEKITICGLLRKAIGLSPELRSWAEIELKKQAAAEGIESGFDFTTGDSLSVPHAIYRLLHA